MKTRLAVAAALALALSTSACHKDPTHPYTTLGSMDAMRAAFNADRGKVRIVMLVSPS